MNWETLHWLLNKVRHQPLSNMKIISCVRFEWHFRGQIFTRRRSIAVAMWLMREEIWTEKIFKDDAGYFLRITKNHKCAGVSFPMWRKIARLHQRVFFANTRKENEGTCCRVKNLHFVSDKPPRSFHLNGVILYTILQGQEKTMQTIHKPYIQPCISLISRALRNV